MGLYESDHPDVPGMKGLHLFHFTVSNCSQRVRLGLEEKGLAWTSHHLDLPGNEHVTSDYRRINPGCVVPTLVHDGQVVLESNDILIYLDEQFPEPGLRPADAVARRKMEQLIGASGAFQSTIKTLSHELLFRPFRKIGADEIALYEAQKADPELLAFLRDYAEAGPAWDARVAEARRAMAATLHELENALDGSPWLSGAEYGLADISWVVNANRLLQAQVDLASWPRFQDWARRVMERPTFDRAVVNYRPATGRS
jgi:glutathione S-transferase